ncbi:MAG: DUF4923 family protein [Rikenellaceae bacterium]|nr:DUF4923 family protein [Rikenellaceae bacterium]
MKKLLIALVALVATATTASAQSWGDLLKQVAGSAATEIVDKVTSGALSDAALNGTWSYKKPAVKFESENILSSLGGSAIESSVTSRLETAYNFIGIKEGAASFTFNDDDTFTAKLGMAKNLSGTYEFDPETHKITLHFAGTGLMKNLGTMSGYAYISGKELKLVFPVTKLINMIRTLGSKISYLKNISALLENYENVYLGFGFAK